MLIELSSVAEVGGLQARVKQFCNPVRRESGPVHQRFIQGGVPSPMQLWRDLHWGDTEEARDENEGALGCLSEGDTGEVSPCRTCVGEPPSNQMGGGNGD